MNIGIKAVITVFYFFNNTSGFLSCRTVVEVNQVFIINFFGQNGKICPYLLNLFVCHADETVSYCFLFGKSTDFLVMCQYAKVSKNR